MITITVMLVVKIKNNYDNNDSDSNNNDCNDNDR